MWKGTATADAKAQIFRHSESAGRGIPPSGAEQCVTVDAETQILRHSEAAARGIPHSGATQYVVVPLQEPTGGFPRGARE